MEGARADTTAPPDFRGSRWSFPFVVLVVGFLVTFAFAGTKRDSAVREREILFDAAVQGVSDDLIVAVDEEVAELQSAINFISATHPSPLRQFERFLANDGSAEGEGEGEGLDLSIMFLERVEPEDLDALIDREQRLGQPDFGVLGLGRVPGEPHLIITRTVRDLNLLGFPARGLDLSLARKRLVPGALPTDGIEIWGLDSNVVLDTVSERVEGDPTPLGEGFATVIITLGGPVHDDRGELTGWALSFIDVDRLRGDITVPEGMSANLSLSGMVGSILHIGPEAASDNETVLSTQTAIATGSLLWTIDAGADGTFGPGTGLLDQSRTWLIGLGITVFAAVAAMSRQITRRRLDLAAFELEHARTLASTDALTGLLNRMGFVDSTRVVDASEPATLFFVDLDGFKGVNDRNGHEAGDLVLREVASAVRNVFRPDDLVGRLGGDEFVIFTPGTTGREYEREICSRIQDVVDGLEANITCSIGVAARAAGLKTDVKTLMRTADEAMYEAKRAGGSRSTLSH
ncbi:MAG: GGDEF domain-containing protein [Acidimicrobiales bacterium]